MEKVNWGVLGTAGIAKSQTIPGMLVAENCNLYAIAGRTIEKAEAFQAEFGFEKAYGSYEELLADANVQAVYIPLPNHVHLEWIAKAARAGKHILCEKPMCMSVEDTKKAFAVCKENGVMLMEAFAYQHSDAIKEIVRLIRDGEAGEVRLIEACFFTGPPAEGDYRWNKEFGGGAVYDLGCYSISLTQSILGELPCKTEAIGSFTPEGIDEFCQMYLQYAGGAKATLGCGFVARGRSDRMVIHGTKGSLWADIVFNQEGRNAFEVRTDTGVQAYEFNVKSNYSLEVEQLGRCILNGEKPYITEEFSLQVATVIEDVRKRLGA